jgi:transcriptional regulator with XRE-family HTH domain
VARAALATPPGLTPKEEPFDAGWILPEQRLGHQSPWRGRGEDVTGGWSRRPELFALGAAVRELRARRGLSQEQLGARADTHRNYIGGIERGELNVTFRVLLKVAGGLGVPLSDVIVLYERNRATPQRLPPIAPARLARNASRHARPDERPVRTGGESS